MPFTKHPGFVIYKPVNYDSTKQYPVIVLLHGQGERGDGSTTGLTNLFDFLNSPYNNILASLDKSGNYLLVAPQLPTTLNYWPLEYVQKGIDYALITLNANPKRVYLGWISLGGSGGWKWLALPGNSLKIAAAFSVCAVQGWSDVKELANIKCPVWGFHELDDYVPASSTITAIDTINSFNPAVKSTKTLYPVESPMNHFIWAKVFDPNASPGVNGETVTLLGWLDLNQQGSPVAVPTNSNIAPPVTPPPISPPPSPVPTTLKAAPLVTNLTTTSATLDGSKSEGFPSYSTWEMIKKPLKARDDVWPGNGWEKGGPVLNIKNLVAGEYVFELTIGKGGQIAKAPVTFTIPATIKPPVIKEQVIPAGATKVILLEGNVIEFV